MSLPVGTIADVGGYDVIGDVHGYLEPLEGLLREMGYRKTDGVYRHPERQVVFVGDIIDRGPDQVATLRLVRSMVEAGTALITMGNHEFNAIGWTTRNAQGEWSRPHTDSNRRHHVAFLDAVGEGSAQHAEWVAWFSTLPLWLDLGGLRVVHACWHLPSMALLGDGRLRSDIVTALKGSEMFAALEIVLKGPEIEMAGHRYLDKSGICRDKARLRWWDPAIGTVADAAEVPHGVTDCAGGRFGPLPEDPIDTAVLAALDYEVPILYGHYWRWGDRPLLDSTRTACLDWSVAAGGPLVAYRWSGERDLDSRNLVYVKS